jgi:hypothetical protein
MLHRRYFFCGQKGRGNEVGETKQRGKGTKKLMTISDNAGIPIAVHVASASPHEVNLAEATVSKCFIADEKPEHLVLGGKAYYR